MHKTRLYPLIAAAALAGTMIACESSTEVALVNDATITSDVAASSGDVIATAVGSMIANETTAQLSSLEASPGAVLASLTDNSGVAFVRTRTCLDAAGAAVVNCTPLSSVRKIITRVTMDGTRSGTNDSATKSWTGAVHRVSNDTVTRVFSTATPPVETSRVHADVTTGNDTTTFTEGTFTRKVVEAAVDSVKQVTFNVPRSQNPWPVSGSIVRRVNVTFTVTKGGKTETKQVTRTIQVDFPADAQGNVVLKINGKTCNLNLVTHVVSGCK